MFQILLLSAIFILCLMVCIISGAPRKTLVLLVLLTFSSFLSFCLSIKIKEMIDFLLKLNKSLYTTLFRSLGILCGLILAIFLFKYRIISFMVFFILLTLQFVLFIYLRYGENVLPLVHTKLQEYEQDRKTIKQHLAVDFKYLQFCRFYISLIAPNLFFLYNLDRTLTLHLEWSVILFFYAITSFLLLLLFNRVNIYIIYYSNMPVSGKALMANATHAATILGLGSAITIGAFSFTSEDQSLIRQEKETLFSKPARKLQLMKAPMNGTFGTLDEAEASIRWKEMQREFPVSNKLVVDPLTKKILPMEVDFQFKLRRIRQGRGEEFMTVEEINDVKARSEKIKVKRDIVK